MRKLVRRKTTEREGSWNSCCIALGVNVEVILELKDLNKDAGGERWCEVFTLEGLRVDTMINKDFQGWFTCNFEEIDELESLMIEIREKINGS